MIEKFDVGLDIRFIEVGHLDITSYLSASDRSNTCNEHVGTVYRIFTDLIDRGWWEKFIPFYNWTKHNVDKFVVTSATEKGQMHKAEHGKLKIPMLIDLPVSAGLLVKKEYKCFCNWPSI